MKITDPILDIAIRIATNNPDGKLSISQINQIESLMFTFSDISNIADLEFCTGLTHLELAHTRVDDFTPLGQLINLRSLWLEGFSITEVPFITNLVNLTHLGIEETSITDITPLANLINLNELGLGANDIRDITPLSNLTNLTKLRLHSN